jgi:signal transduction histidine kinase
MLAARARMAGDGTLLSADAAILRLQEAAGGRIGTPFLIPAPARLAALAHRLRQPIERPVVMGDEDREVRAHGRFIPDHGGVRIELVEWEESAAPQADTAEPLPPVKRRVVPPGVIRWACDVRLRLVMVDADAAWGLTDRDWMGRSLAQLFQLNPDDLGGFPLLVGLAEQSSFSAQSARVALGPAEGTVLLLRAQAMIDEDRSFTGFVGEAAPVGFGRLPADVSVGEDADSGAANLLGTLDTRSFALRIDGALRRPLGRIVANAQTIANQLQGPIRADYVRYASDIALAGKHLLDLVDDLADLQAVDRDNFTIARERVDLADLSRRAAGLLAMKAQERGIRIDPPRDDEQAVGSGEFRRVLQILINLLSNAIRYSPEGSFIWLRVDRQGGQVSVTVADQGPGIPVEDQGRLFQKFERLGRSSDDGGSGLGLYISRRLAQAMGGDILVDSAAGQGARFTLTLPAMD